MTNCLPNNRMLRLNYYRWTLLKFNNGKSLTTKKKKPCLIANIHAYPYKGRVNFSRTRGGRKEIISPFNIWPYFPFQEISNKGSYLSLYNGLILPLTYPRYHASRSPFTLQKRPFGRRRPFNRQIFILHIFDFVVLKKKIRKFMKFKHNGS